MNTKKRITRYSWIGLLLCCFLLNKGLAQEKSMGEPWHFGTELSTSLTYVGLGTGLLGQFQNGRHLGYLGPRLVLSDSYLPQRGPWGMQLGYQYYWVKEGRWRSFVALDYQLTWYDPYNPRQLPVKGKNQVHEIHLAYGIQYQLSTKVLLGSMLGTGGYVERLQDLIEGRTQSYRGYSSLIRLFVRYVWSYGIEVKK